MSILIIIGIVMFILALANWSQSQGYFQRFFRLFGADSLSDESHLNNSAVSIDNGAARVSGGNGSIMVNNSAFALDEDYAYDDDSDYFDEF